ncbi:HepT-like ribonuclease domain-containing protein [Colwelliaceae bacterium MEBiC 14330]
MTSFCGLYKLISRDKPKKVIALLNIAVHNYKALNLAIFFAIVNKHLVDFELFSEEIKNNFNCKSIFSLRLKWLYLL